MNQINPQGTPSSKINMSILHTSVAIKIPLTAIIYSKHSNYDYQQFKIGSAITVISPEREGQCCRDYSKTLHESHNLLACLVITRIFNCPSKKYIYIHNSSPSHIQNEICSTTGTYISPILHFIVIQNEEWVKTTIKSAGTQTKRVPFLYFLICSPTAATIIVQTDYTVHSMFWCPFFS